MKGSVHKYKRAEQRKAATHVVQRTKPLCVLYDEVRALRRAMLEAKFARPMRDKMHVSR
jgi:hypothetical protein